MTFETLLFEENGAIGTLTINRPNALNALNETVLNELYSFTNQIKDNKNIRVLIITGSGEKAFVAGADIKAMQGMSEVEAVAFSKKAQEAFNAIEALPFAVIAAVNGFALGGGCELALACDIILASENAKFGLPETNLGLLPCFGGTQRLPRAIGLYRAKEMIFSGNFYKAEEAREFGFVNYVYSLENLLIEANKLAETIAIKGPVAVGRAKEAMHTGTEIHISEALENESKLFGSLFETEDQREGISAFIEKRIPNFKGN